MKMRFLPEKRTKITDPAATEFDFNIKQVKSGEDLPTFRAVARKNL